MPPRLDRSSVRRTTVGVLGGQFHAAQIVPRMHVCSDSPCVCVCVGVLHGAVVLITKLCEQNSEALERFRKVHKC